MWIRTARWVWSSSAMSASSWLTRRCSRPAAADAHERATQRPAAGLLNGRVVRWPRNRRSLLVELFVSAIAVSCSTPPASGRAVEEQAVYAAVLNTEFVHEGTGCLVLHTDRTRVPDLAIACPDAELRHALQRAMAPRTSLSGPVAAGLPVVLVSDRLLAESTADYWGFAWEPFFAAYPGAEGIITLSAVGFSADRQRAMLLYNFQCGSVCGNGGYYTLANNSGVWAISGGGSIVEY